MPENIFDKLDVLIESKNSNIAPESYDKSDLYKYAGEKIGYVSRYGSYSPYRDNENYYAEQQSGLDKFKNATLGAGVLAGTTLVNHFTGYIRDVNAITSGDWNKLWNDELGMESARKMGAVADLFPIYETTEQQSRRDNSTGAWGAVKQFIPFTGRAGNAWANIGQQFGFSLGTMAAIGIEELVLVGITSATGGGAAPVATAKTALNAKKLFSMRSMWNTIKEGKNLYNMGKVAKDANTLTKVLRSRPMNIYRQVAAAKGEAAIEANFAALEYREEQIDKYVEKYGTYPPQEFLAEMEDNVLGVGNSTFNMNVAVLTATNYAAYRTLFKPSNLSLSRFVDDFAKKDILKGLAAEGLTKTGMIQGVLKNSPRLATALSYGAKAGRVLGVENFSEGFEEVAQGIASGAAKRQFDMFDSDYGKGVGAYLLASADEFSETAGSKEMWDEFTAGFMTGFGIQAGTKLINKARGVDKRKAKVVEDSINQVVKANSAYTNAINQFVTAEKLDEAENKNKINEAKKLKHEAETQLFTTLEKNGVAKEYFEQLGETFKETLGNEAKEILKDRGVDEVVGSLKRDYEVFEQDLNKQRKRIGNPYSERDRNYEAWDAALALSVRMESSSKDMLKRSKKLFSEINQKFGVDTMFLEGIVDPTTIVENKRKLQQDLEMAKSRLGLETISEIEKQKTQDDIVKIEDRLKIFTGLNDRYFDENGEYKDVLGGGQKVSEILKGLLLSSNKEEAMQALNDMENLEREGSQYMKLYNLLSTKEGFDKFGKAFVESWFTGMDNIKAKIDDNLVEQPTIEPTEKISKEELENAIEEKSTGEIQSARQAIEDLIEANDVIKNADGTFEYGGKTYNDANELFDQIKKDKELDQEALDTNLGEQTFEQALKKRLNATEEQPADNPQNTQEEVEKIKKNNLVTKKEPKTKKSDEDENFNFIQNSGQTLVHYFDVVMGAIWNTFDYTLKKLALTGKEAVRKQITDAQEAVGGVSTLSNIYLASEEQLNEMLGGGVKEFNERHSDVQVVYDGIRLFIITQGDAKNAQETLIDLFGVNLNTTGKIVSLENEKGENISSGFRASIGFNEITDEAVFSVKKGDNVNLMVLDNEFNRTLMESGKSQEEKIDQLAIGVFNTKDELVGVLRAGDFLYEKHSESLKKYREQIIKSIKDDTIGAFVGSTSVTAFSTARNYNIVDGKKQYTPAGEYTPTGYNKEYFYVTDDGQLINEKGEVVENPNFERGRLAINAVYMKLTGKGNAKQITTQLVRETESSRFTKEEFEQGKHLTDGLTGLKDNPIISRRLIIDMATLKEEEVERENNVEEVREEVTDTQEILITKEDVQSEITKNKKEPLKGLFRGKLVDNLIKYYQQTSNETKLKEEDLFKEVRKRLGNILSKDEYEEIEESGLLDGIKPKKGKTLKITDKGGGTATIENASIEGDVLTNGTESIALTDIDKVEAPTPTKEEIKQEEWEAFLEEEQGEAEELKWLNENGIVGETYNNKDSKITIKARNENATYIVENGNYYAIDNDNNKQTLSPNGGMFIMENGKGIEASELNIEHNIDKPSDFINTLSANISSYGVDGNFLLSKLVSVFKEAYKKGYVITEINELMDAANLSREEREILAGTMTPIFQSYLWKMMLNSESVWNMQSEKRWNEFSEGLLDTANFLESVFIEGVPLMEYRKALESEDKVLDKLAKKTRIKINIRSLKNFNPNWLREFGKSLKEALTVENLQERYDKFVNVLSKYQLTLVQSGVKILREVNKKSIDRNPFYNTDNGIMTDISMISFNGKNYIKNEADGTFVEKPYRYKKTSLEILSFQKQFVSLLGINLPIGYLQNYLEINGTLDNLRERAITYKRNLELRNQDSVILQEVVKKGKMIVSETDSPMAEFEGKQYSPIMNTMGGKTIYLEQGATITPTQLREIMREENVMRNTRKKIVSFGNRVRNMKNLQKQIEELTCKL